MKITALLHLLIMMLITIDVFAQVSPVPSLMNFQGRLATPSGNPVPDGTYSIRFSLWDNVSGGTENWNQTIDAVAVRNGTFTVLLSSFPANAFNGNLWLEIKIGTDAPLTPRQQLVTVAYAMKANSVADGAITGASIANGTITGDKFAANIFNPLAWLLGGNSGTDPLAHFLGTTDNQPLVFRTNNTEWVRLLTNGNFGIGTATPGAMLEVRGGANPTSLQVLPGSLLGVETADTVTLDIPGVNGTLGIWDNLKVDGTATMSGFRLGTSATAGHVLTADAGGNGTWQAFSLSGITAGGDLSGTYPNPTIASNAVTTGKIADNAVASAKLASEAASLSRVSGGAMSSTGSSIGIGTATPAGPLDVYGFQITGAESLDQQQTGFTGLQVGQEHWQSFTPANSGFASRIDLQSTAPRANQLGRIATPGTLYFYSGEGTGGTLLATQNVTFQPVPDGTWQTFLLDSPFQLTAGQIYTVRFSAPLAQDNLPWAGANANNSYSGGRSDLNANTDYGFKTYLLASGNGSMFVVKPGGKVGIGTATPGQKLSVAGTVESTSGGFKFPDGTTQITAAVGLGSTAGGDLTGTYPNPSLATLASSLYKVSGGVMNSNAGRIGIGTATPTGLLDVYGFRAPSVETLDQQQTAHNAGTGGTSCWQSFTPANSGYLSRIDLEVYSPLGNVAAPGTLYFYSGEGTGGTLLATQNVTFQPVPNDTFQVFRLDAPFPVAAGQKYTVRFTTPQSSSLWVDLHSGNLYAGGRADGNATDDYLFKTYVFASGGNASLLTVQSGGKVGIGTTTPVYDLDVNGIVGVAGNLVVDRNNSADGTANTAQPALRFGGFSSGEAIVSKRTAGGNQFGLDFYTASVNRLSITSSGAINATGSLNAPSATIATLNGNVRVTGGLTVDSAGANDGTIASPAMLRLGSIGGEGIGSNHATESLDFYTGFSRRMTIAINGYVGIGTTTPAYRLELPNTANNDGRARANSWVTYSSGRWKHNVTEIENPLEKLIQLRGVMFDWNVENGGGHDIGFVAEEAGAVVPELVVWEANGKFAQGMKYDRVTALLVEAVKVQQKQVETLNARTMLQQKQSNAKDAEITTMKAKNAELEARLTRIEALLQRMQK